jgi:cytochrome c oxidase assembly protein subunit 11
MIAETQTRQDNHRMLGKLLMVAILMFAFGFALVPFYEKICEITGINILASRDKLNRDEARRFAANTQVDTSRLVSVEFDANAHGPWRFKPRLNVTEVHPGELVTVIYEIENTLDRTVSGQAIPSYAPKQSASHFKKLECFCFEQQDLAAGQTREFPVVFVIDPELPDGIRNITLSYTFFEIGAGIPRPPQPASAVSSQPLALPQPRS